MKSCLDSSSSFFWPQLSSSDWLLSVYRHDFFFLLLLSFGFCHRFCCFRSPLILSRSLLLVPCLATNHPRWCCIHHSSFIIIDYFRSRRTSPLHRSSPSLQTNPLRLAVMVILLPQARKRPLRPSIGRTCQSSLFHPFLILRQLLLISLLRHQISRRAAAINTWAPRAALARRCMEKDRKRAVYAVLTNHHRRQACFALHFHQHRQIRCHCASQFHIHNHQ